MNLLIYSHSFAPNVGGIETIVLSLAQGLVDMRGADGEREFELTVATETPGDTLGDAGLSFPVIRQVGLLRLWQLIRAADVVHVAGPAMLPLALGWICGKPLVIEHHGYQAVCPNGLLLRQPDGSVCPGHFLNGEYPRCARCLRKETSFWSSWAKVLLMFPRRALAKRAAANVAVSDHVVSRSAMPNTQMIYHGIELAGDSAAPSQPRGEGPMRFACVGRLVGEKGVPVAIEAMRLLSEESRAELLLIGDGPERSSSEALIQRHGLGARVRITGFLSGAALAETVSTVDAVLMPSIWEETAGLAAIEQMMRGKLVIVSDIGGLAEIVGDAGIKFAAGDATALAEAMRTVIQNPSLAESLGKRARARAQTLFRRDRMITEHAALYRRLGAHRR